MDAPGCITGAGEVGLCPPSRREGRIAATPRLPHRRSQRMLFAVESGTTPAEVEVPTRVRCCSRCRAIYRSDYLRCPTDGAEITMHDGDPLIGTTLGEHYVIEACVGEGAMGRVYRARHLRLE